MHERDPINFDFRVVALLTAMITNPDLLDQYVNGANLDQRDPQKWPTLISLGFSGDLLNDVLFLFQRHDVRSALLLIQRVYKTMLAIDEYCDLGCPDNDWLSRYLVSTRQIPQPLKPAGVEIGR